VSAPSPPRATVSTCRVGARLKPGQKGTKKLLRDFGDRLVCVRYRYDEGRRTRFTTVEIVVGEAPWKPRPARIVEIDVRPWEISVRENVKKAGGTWQPEKKLWKMRRDQALKLGLAARIRPEPTLKKYLSAETSKYLSAETSARKVGKVSITTNPGRRLI
jgi:hypothetical protein